MTIRTLIRKNVVPADYVKRMRATEPGKLAGYLSDILYGAREQDVPTESPASRRCFVVNHEIFISELHDASIKGNHPYINVERTLLDIQQILEEYALRLVLEQR